MQWVRPHGIDSKIAFYHAANRAEAGLTHKENSQTNQSLTYSNCALSNLTTPHFGSYSLRTSSTSGRVTWGTKTRTSDYTSPLTVEFWFYPRSALSSAVAYVMEASSTPVNGDFVCIQSASYLQLDRWTGTGTNVRGRVATVGSPTPSTWNHMVYQSDDSTATYGLNGKLYHASVVSSTRDIHGSPYIGYGNVDGYTAIPSGSCFQEVMILNYAKYPSSGSTYTVPTRSLI